MRKSASTESMDSETASVIRKLLLEEKRRMPSRRSKQSVDYRQEYISVGVDNCGAKSSRTSPRDLESGSPQSELSNPSPERCSSAPNIESLRVQTRVKNEQFPIGDLRNSRDGTPPLWSGSVPIVKLERIDQSRLFSVSTTPAGVASGKSCLKIKTEKPDSDNDMQKKNSTPCIASDNHVIKSEQKDSGHSDKNQSKEPSFDLSKINCPHCQMVFPSKNYILSHLNFCSKRQRLYQCEVCAKLFPSESVLKIHLLIHGQKPNKKNLLSAIKREPFTAIIDNPLRISETGSSKTGSCTSESAMNTTDQTSFVSRNTECNGPSQIESVTAIIDKPPRITDTDSSISGSSTSENAMNTNDDQTSVVRRNTECYGPSQKEPVTAIIDSPPRTSNTDSRKTGSCASEIAMNTNDQTSVVSRNTECNEPSRREPVAAIIDNPPRPFDSDSSKTGCCTSESAVNVNDEKSVVTRNTECNEPSDNDVMIIETPENDERITDPITIIDDDDDMSACSVNRSTATHGERDKSYESHKSDIRDIENKQQHQKQDFGGRNRRLRPKEILFAKPKRHRDVFAIDKPVAPFTGRQTGAQITCSQCHKTFRSRGKLRSHVRLYHSYYKADKWTGRSPVLQPMQVPTRIDKTEINCPCCFKIFFTRRSLLQHLRSCFRKTRSYSLSAGLTTCAIKGKRVPRKYTLNNSSNTCPYCGVFFDEWKRMILHLKDCYDKAWPYQCKICERSFKNERPFKIHKLFHDEGTAVKCQVCNKGFSSSFELNEHLFEKHPESVEETLISSEYDKKVKKRSQCPSNNASDLRGINNERVSRKRKKNANHLDGVSLSLRRNVSHETGFEIENFECDIGNLMTPTKGSTAERPRGNRSVPCTLCDETLPSKAHLSRHILVTHSETIDDDGSPIRMCTKQSKRNSALRMSDVDLSSNNTSRNSNSFSGPTNIAHDDTRPKHRCKTSRVYDNYLYNDNSVENHCPRCNAEFKHIRDYFEHNCNGVDSYRLCYICLTHYAKGISIVEHLNTHRSSFRRTRESPKHCKPRLTLTCPFCSHTVHSDADLTKHMSLHSELYGDGLQNLAQPSRRDATAELVDNDETMFTEKSSGSGRPNESHGYNDVLLHRYDWQYHCNVCYERCCSDDFIKQHRKEHPAVLKTFSCFHCKKAVFRVHDEYVKHSESHKYPYSCTLCRKVFVTGFELIRHRYLYHEMMRMCSRCHQRFPDLDSLRLHWCQHSSERDEKVEGCQPIKEHNFKFRCGRCPAKLPSKNGLFSHFQKCHLQGMHTCSECQEVITEPKREHNNEQISLLKHKREKPSGIKCSLCAKKFSEKYRLVKHMVVRHLEQFQRDLLSSSLRSMSDNTFECSFCDWIFSSPGDWAEHTKKHRTRDMRTLKRQQLFYVLSQLMKEHSYPKSFPKHSEDSSSESDDTDDSSEAEREERGCSRAYCSSSVNCNGEEKRGSLLENELAQTDNSFEPTLLSVCGKSNKLDFSNQDSSVLLSDTNFDEENFQQSRNRNEPLQTYSSAGIIDPLGRSFWEHEHLSVQDLTVFNEDYMMGECVVTSDTQNSENKNETEQAETVVTNNTDGFDTNNICPINIDAVGEFGTKGIWDSAFIIEEHDILCDVETEAGEPAVDAETSLREQDTPEADVQEGIPETGVQEEIPETGVQEEIPEAGVQEEIPEAGVQEEIPEADVQEEIPETDVREEIPETDVREEIPETDLREAISIHAMSWKSNVGMPACKEVESSDMNDRNLTEASIGTSDVVAMACQSPEDYFREHTNEAASVWVDGKSKTVVDSCVQSIEPIHQRAALSDQGKGCPVLRDYSKRNGPCENTVSVAGNWRTEQEPHSCASGESLETSHDLNKNVVNSRPFPTMLHPPVTTVHTPNSCVSFSGTDVSKYILFESNIAEDSRLYYCRKCFQRFSTHDSFGHHLQICLL